MAKSTPYFDMDLTRMFDISKFAGEFKVPGIDVDQMLAAQRKNVEALTAAQQLAFEGLQAVFRRQGEIVRQSVEQTGTIMTELLAPGAPEEKVAKNAELTKAAFEKALSNAKELSELVAKSNAEAANVLNKRFTESLDELKTAVQKARK
ncbi:phasin family protein [Arenibaculum sp.]|jgi:phasin family protein|uniref:phasin family protein n=1 Tax=Arenibaculum sp. TaxID=2865862 RepID=UPI002E1013ED|nr:phasin family protein [Arenibaculum sp.]